MRNLLFILVLTLCLKNSYQTTKMNPYIQRMAELEEWSSIVYQDFVPRNQKTDFCKTNLSLCDTQALQDKLNQKINHKFDMSKSVVKSINIFQKFITKVRILYVPAMNMLRRVKSNRAKKFVIQKMNKALKNYLNHLNKVGGALKRNIGKSIRKTGNFINGIKRGVRRRRNIIWRIRQRNKTEEEEICY